MTLAGRKPLLLAMLALVASTVSVAGQSPVNFNDLRASMIARYPNTPVELRIRNHGRIHFFRDDKVRVYTKAGKSSPFVNSEITSFGANRFCIAENRGWSGVCISLFQDDSGGYLCEGAFGNGYGYEKSDCWIKALD